MARPFDLDTRQLRGEAFPLAERVTTEQSRYVGASVSENGTLVYGQAGADVARQLTWFDRTGRELGTLSDAAPYSGLALSPDERRVAVTLETGAPNNVDIWLIDIARNIRSRLTVHPGQERSPVWSPDGARIAFQSSRSRQPIAMRQTLSDETGTDELLLEGPGNFTMTPSGWSSDGQFIAYTTRGSNVWILPLFGDRKPFRVRGYAVHRSIGRVLAGWPMDRIHEQRRWPAGRLRAVVSRAGREISSVERRWEPSCVESGRPGIVLPRAGWDDDVRPDRTPDVHSMPDCRRPSFAQTSGHSRATRSTP